MLNRERLSSSDDWHDVVDRKKRKQIQDRLAQRARRKRLAKDKKSIPNDTPTGINKTIGLQAGQVQASTDCQCSRGCICSVNQFSSDHSSVTDTSVEHHASYVEPKAHSFNAILMQTGKLLGIRCGMSFPCKSNPAPRDTPECLQPTLLQLSAVHWQWIDRFPFPDFRDEIILNSGNIDEEEFLEDLFSIDAFTLSRGGNPFDFSTYTINPHFQIRWGYLFPSFPMEPTD
ncbi:hypothetical protein BT63DRAFT_449568 [Microthyrium microscopicum]|uniref:BZIP domain-containing protein n=1 Tax=Microthyrium microscopicum TaxID=703497 RepID=A0A6A6UQL0_9PEZI|nr:hypothetical protein BT63DRAFT_449568 [Microthyrium microscopicum]